MVTNKFGKISGPGAAATPADNSVTTGKIFDGTIAAADLGALSVTAAKLNADVITASTGLAGAAGAAIEFAPSACTAAAVDVANDEMVIIDHDDSHAPRKEAVADLVTAIAGTASASALTATSGVLKVAPADNAITIAADSLVYVTAAGVTKKDLASDVATAMADGTTISAAAGVLSVKTSSLGIAQMANDDKASTFVVYGDHDFGQAGAKDTDLGALGAKGTLIGGYLVMTEAANGGATHDIIVSSAATGGTPLATTITVTTANTADGQSNIIGATRGIAPLAAGTDVASTAHIYVYTAADGARTTGIVKVVLIFQKSA